MMMMDKQQQLVPFYDADVWWSIFDEVHPPLQLENWKSNNWSSTRTPSYFRCRSAMQVLNWKRTNLRLWRIAVSPPKCCKWPASNRCGTRFTRTGCNCREWLKMKPGELFYRYKQCYIFLVILKRRNLGSPKMAVLRLLSPRGRNAHFERQEDLLGSVRHCSSHPRPSSLCE